MKKHLERLFNKTIGKKGSVLQSDQLHEKHRIFKTWRNIQMSVN